MLEELGLKFIENTPLLTARLEISDGDTAPTGSPNSCYIYLFLFYTTERKLKLQCATISGISIHKNPDVLPQRALHYKVFRRVPNIFNFPLGYLDFFFLNHQTIETQLLSRRD